MWLLIIGIIVGIVLFSLMRKRENTSRIYYALLIITSIPTIPIFLTELWYSSPVLHDFLVVLFISSVVASILGKGWLRRALTISFVLLILYGRGPLLNIHYPMSQPGDFSEGELVEQFEFENYLITLEKRDQSTRAHWIWKGKKFVAGGLLFERMSIKTKEASDQAHCQQTLEINHVASYEKGILELERTVKYDTCYNKILMIR